MNKSQKNKLTKLLRETCFARDSKCLRCGREDTLAPSHIYPKGKYQRMRYELDNVKTLCYGCHFHFWHSEPLKAAVWIKEVIDAPRLKKLKKMAQSTSLPLLDYDKIKETLETLKKDYETLNKNK